MRAPIHLLAATLALAACSTSLQPTPPDDDGGDDGDDPAACVAGRTYVGLGGDALEADRAVGLAGADRLRLKPFAALATEFDRALGLTGFDTRAYAATFGRPPARWFEEPAASANTLYGSFALAFDACKQHTASGGVYDAAPTAETADVVCRDLARRGWDRAATDDEASACATYAVNQTLASDPPARRWAYACAAVMSASGFLAY